MEEIGPIVKWFLSRPCLHPLDPKLRVTIWGMSFQEYHLLFIFKTSMQVTYALTDSGQVLYRSFIFPGMESPL
jgi:hypothetical protein